MDLSFINLLPMKRVQISNQEIQRLVAPDSPEFPKYVTQLLNLVNSNAQGTRPSVVGQMTELLTKSKARTVAEWRSYYDEKMPNGIAAATDKIKQKLVEMQSAMASITDDMVKDWVEDLVYIKTFTGLRVQDVILSYLAQQMGDVEYRVATAVEESQGIDGWIKDHPIQVKPSTYEESMASFSEVIKVPIVYYEKKREGLFIKYPEDLLE